MLKGLNCPVIAIEEHYLDAELAAHFSGDEVKRSGELFDRLSDFSDLRIKEMDAAGVDIQVLSHNAPSAQKLPADIAAALIRRVNDRLAEKVKTAPERFAGFAALPTAVPDAAADELERCVRDLGFKGAMLHGMSHGVFLDDKRFWPIYERAEKLDVPVYMHPALPHAAVVDAYYNDYVKDFPNVIRPAWGFTVETATLAIRLILSGVFERYPRLKIVLGHLGETLPFLLWRIDYSLRRPGGRHVDFRKTFCNNFWVTTSGFFSNPALLCCMMELGVERILFAVDYPFVPSIEATQWIKDAPVADCDKAKILSGNARRLLKM